MASTELVHLVAFSIERGNRLLVIVLGLARTWCMSFSHRFARLDLGSTWKLQGRRQSA